MRSIHLLAMISILNVLSYSAMAYAGEQSGGGGIKKYESQDDAIGTDQAPAILSVPTLEWSYLEASILDGKARYSKSLGQRVFGLEVYQSPEGLWRLDVETEFGEIYTLEAR